MTPKAADTVLPMDDYFRRLFDAVPCPILVVDADVAIISHNAAAAGFLGDGAPNRYLVRAGEALHCLHAIETEGGCGESVACHECVVRNSVRGAIHGKTVQRRKTRMVMHDVHGEREVFLLVTGSPFEYGGRQLALLIFEDISELMQLRKFVPICSYCRKIRNDRNYWDSVEAYFHEHADIHFSHSICDECYDEHFKDEEPDAA